MTVLGGTDEPIHMGPDWLASLGYHRLTEAQALIVVRRAYAALETVVGAQLTWPMSERQMDSFGQLVDSNASQSEVAKWMEEHASDYGRVAHLCFARLEDVLRSTAKSYAESAEMGNKTKQQRLNNPEATIENAEDVR